MEGSLKSCRRPSRSKTKSVNVPPVSTPMRGLTLSLTEPNCQPSTHSHSSARMRIEHELNSIAILKSRGIFDDCFSGSHRFDRSQPQMP